MKTAAKIAAALGGAKHDASGWRCCCPAHDDHTPSLSVTEKAGKVLFTWRAGCDQQAVISALRQRHLWPEPGDERPHIVAPNASIEPLAVSPAEAGHHAGVGRTTIYSAISSGELRSLKIGARRLVAIEALREWLLKHEVDR